MLEICDNSKFALSEDNIVKNNFLSTKLCSKLTLRDFTFKLIEMRTCQTQTVSHGHQFVIHILESLLGPEESLKKSQVRGDATAFPPGLRMSYKGRDDVLFLFRVRKKIMYPPALVLCCPLQTESWRNRERKTDRERKYPFV